VQAGKEHTWMKEFLGELGLFPTPFPPTVIHQDNKSAIALSVGGVSHKRSKHFGIDFDKFRELVKTKQLDRVYKETDLLAADMFTKSLPPDKFKRHRNEIMGGENEQLYFLSFVPKKPLAVLDRQRQEKYRKRKSRKRIEKRKQ